MRMLYDAAGRIGEILNLRLGDIRIGKSNSDPTAYNVRRKKGKFRDLYLSMETLGELKAYLKFAGINRPEQPLFPNQRDPTRPMPDKLLLEHIARYLKSRGIERKMYGTHIGRHSAIYHMLARGADPYVVADLASHDDSLETTLGVYGAPTREDVFKAYREHMPKMDMRSVHSIIKGFKKNRAQAHS
jgi:site-specific recombinase XerD